MTFSPKAPSFVAGQQEQEATSKIGMHAFRYIVLRVNFICNLSLFYSLQIFMLQVRLQAYARAQTHTQGLLI